MACKVQGPRNTLTERFWAQWRELKIWRTASRSKYVVQLYDACYNPDSKEFRMYTELCEGGDLYDLVKQSMRWTNRLIHP